MILFRVANISFKFWILISHLVDLYEQYSLFIKIYGKIEHYNCALDIFSTVLRVRDIYLKKSRFQCDFKNGFL